MEIETLDRIDAELRMPEVTTRHIGSQALDEVRRCLINVFLWQLIPAGQLSTHQSS